MAPSHSKTMAASSDPFRAGGTTFEINTRGDAIGAWLRERIIDGTFKAGIHLQEQALATQTGMSRTPVREALKLLERERLVVHAPNRGYVVRRFDLKDILDAFDVRAALEGLVCRLVATKGLSPRADAVLADYEIEMHDVAFGTTWGDRQSLRWFDLNFQFHALLIEEADNPMLAEHIALAQRLPLIFDANQRLRSTSQMSRLFGPEASRESHRDHVLLLSAIRARDGIEAERVMREHIGKSRESIRRNFPVAFPDMDVEIAE